MSLCEYCICGLVQVMSLLVQHCSVTQGVSCSHFHFYAVFPAKSLGGLTPQPLVCFLCAQCRFLVLLQSQLSYLH